MKRLKSKLLSMEPNTTTFKEMYEGTMLVVPATTQEPWVDYDSTYYREEVAYRIELTHKLAQDKPTVTVMIPTDRLHDIPCSPAAADHCLRVFTPYIEALNKELYNPSRPDRENGKYYVHHPGGEVLPRNTAYFGMCPQKDYENGNGSTIYLLPEGRAGAPRMCLCLMLQVQLPYKKLRKTVQMLCRDLPDAVDQFILQFDRCKLQNTLVLADKQAEIRAYLRESPYCAFVANGSILPRAKATDLPLMGAVPFRSTPEDEIEVCGVRGMGIRRGVTVITGGGYSGKSTLLDAISAGIYDHCLGDGRELCITDASAMTISAEDGRSVKSVNISPFIKWLPNGDTRDFSTDHASGSTSQAANIMEAVDCGTRLLLIDEDRSATNFMIRDRIMKELIEREPIIPFTDRVGELYTSCGVSTILVIGGSGEYFAVADRIYLMEDYLIHDVTERSRVICATYGVLPDQPTQTVWEQKRTLYSTSFTSYPEGSGSERLEVSDMGFIFIGDEKIDIRGLHDIVSKRQLDALGYMLRWIELRNTDRRIDLDSAIDALYTMITNEGLDTVFSSFFTTTERFLDLPRKCELKAVVNRMRRITYSSSSDG